MTNIVLTALPPASATPTLPVGPAAAIAPVAFATVQADVLLPSASPPPQSAPAQGGEAGDSAAMRPDQIFMARQLSYPRPDAPTLAAGWRSMVRQYGSTLGERAVRARGGLLPAALVVSTQEGRVLRTPDPAPGADAWRFTVHAGGAQAQELRVVGRDADPPPGRRKRARVGLRLELTLEDGTRVAVQVEPMPGGVALELAAPNARALARVRQLEPALDEAIARAGLRVMRRSYSETLASGTAPHAFLAATDATTVLTLPVFRAIAEMALVLPREALVQT